MIHEILVDLMGLRIGKYLIAVVDTISVDRSLLIADILRTKTKDRPLKSFFYKYFK